MYFVRITIGDGWFSGTVRPSGGCSLDPRQAPSRADAIGHFGRCALACRMLERGGWLRAADQGDEGAVAADAVAARSEADAEGIPDPHPHLQGRIRTRSLETGYQRPFRVA